jgi:hypothetical protein
LRVALKTTSDSGIFEGVGAFKAGQTFVPRIDGFGGALLDVTNLVGKVTFESVAGSAGTRDDGRRRLKALR